MRIRHLFICAALGCMAVVLADAAIEGIVVAQLGVTR